MKETLEVHYCKNLFNSLGSKERESIIRLSNLTNREKMLIISRFIEGMSLQESAEQLHIEIDSVVKAQRKILKKLYQWLQLKS